MYPVKFAMVMQHSGGIGEGMRGGSLVESWGGERRGTAGHVINHCYRSVLQVYDKPIPVHQTSVSLFHVTGIRLKYYLSPSLLSRSKQNRPTNTTGTCFACYNCFHCFYCCLCCCWWYIFTFKDKKIKQHRHTLVTLRVE